MSRSRIALAGLIAALGLFTAACTQQEPDVTIADQVAAEDRPEASAEGEGTGEGAGEGTGEAAAEGEVIQWAAGNELEYSVAPETVPADTLLVFELELAGLPHDVTIEELGDEVIVAGAEAGTFTGTVTLEPGAYTYYCSVPGHREAGMEGELEAV